MARLHRRYKHRKTRRTSSDPAPRSPRRNPPLMTDMVEWVAPGFGGFAVTRFLTRVAATQIEKRKPSWGKHAGALASVASFLSAWYLANRWKLLAKYHTPITVGAAIAGIQSLIQLYIPKLGWMVADASPELDATAAGALSAPTAQQLNLVPVHDDPNEYTYNDAYDAGRYSKTGASPPIMGPTGSGHQEDLSDLAIDDAIGQTQNLGVFSN